METLRLDSLTHSFLLYWQLYFLRIHGDLNVWWRIIKESALLKTQYINTESFPPNLLPHQPLWQKCENSNSRLFLRLNCSEIYAIKILSLSQLNISLLKFSLRKTQTTQSTLCFWLFKCGNKFKQKYFIYSFVNPFHCNTLVD